MRTKEEAMKLFEENKKLVKFMYGKHFKNDDSIEYADDLIQEGMIGLYSAAKNFDETKGFKFSTYACRAIFYSMLQYKERYLEKHENLKSLNEVYGHDENVELIDLIEDENIDYTEIEIKDLINKLVDALVDSEKQTLKLRLEGKTQREIAKATKVTQCEVSRRLKRIANRLRILEGKEPIMDMKPNKRRIMSERFKEIKKDVMKLRKKGASYQEISMKLNIPKGSISSYLREVS